jgi:hypothetical protein
LTPNSTASHTAYWNDGESGPPTPFRGVKFEVSSGKRTISRSIGDYYPDKLAEDTVLLNERLTAVTGVQVEGKDVKI